jgi:hypothetical protein
MKAFHFLRKNLRSEDDLICGSSSPWQIGETRTYKPFYYDFRDGEIHWQYGYQSSPSLWEAFLNCDGPVACLVDVSQPVHNEAAQYGARNLSLRRKLIDAIDLETGLRHFAIACAERAIGRADANLMNDREVLELLQNARSCFAGEASSSKPNYAYLRGLELASRSSGVRGRGLCIAAAANYPEAEGAAVLVVEMARDVARSAGLNEYFDRQSNRAFFEASFARMFHDAEPDQGLNS